MAIYSSTPLHSTTRLRGRKESIVVNSKCELNKGRKKWWGKRNSTNDLTDDVKPQSLKSSYLSGANPPQRFSYLYQWWCIFVNSSWYPKGREKKNIYQSTQPKFSKPYHHHSLNQPKTHCLINPDSKKPVKHARSHLFMTLVALAKWLNEHPKHCYFTSSHETFLICKPWKTIILYPKSPKRVPMSNSILTCGRG